ncbi:MAG: BTAD domain-containing putative transcriptional regulator [Streptosporangiaceae bacterium]
MNLGDGMGTVRFRILGPLEVWTDEAWSGIGAPKWRALLAMLLLHPNQVVSTERLIAGLWGDEPPDRCANLVSVYVLRLRRLMGDSKGALLATRAPGYLLRIEPGDLDAAVFESAVRRGRQALATQDAVTASAVLTEALALWCGAAMADIPASALITAAADRLEESRLTALELRITADLRCGRTAQLVPEIRQILAGHPLREGLWVLLLQALDAAGRRAEAMAAYGDARQVIAGELGVDPGPELRHLYQRLLDGDLAGAAAGAGSASAQALGAPAQLPADIADFTGRVSHLAQLRGLLTRSCDKANPAAVTVVVVAGSPGLGKTALAIHAAHALRGEFPDGQLYVGLLGAREQAVVPYEVLARLLRDLGTDPRQIPATMEEREALFRTRLADRRMLIVLDGARDAAQVRPLLPGSPSCAVIVTSRRRLADLAGSRLVDLDVLDDDEALRLLTAIVGTDRVSAEPGPAREVLAACAGLPLAIRIAGARLAARRGWEVSTLARRLADQRRRVDELASGDLAVRACFDVSFDHLAELATTGGVDPAHAFRLLGVWQGPSIGLPAAAALIGQPEDMVADALEVLVDASLLEARASERYVFHDLLRAYAAERARVQEDSRAVTEAVARLLDWYLRTAAAAARVVAPLRDQVLLPDREPALAGGPPGPLRFDTADRALEWSARERANLVAATRQAGAYGLHDVAWKLPVAMMACFDRQGFREESLTTHRVALPSARAAGDRPGEAWVLNNTGMALAQQRRGGALECFEAALAIRRELGDRLGQAQTANNIAFLFIEEGMYERAVPALREALDLQRVVGRRHGEGVALCNLGEAYLELGRYDEAISYLRQALPVARETGSSRVEGYVLQHLGRAFLEQGLTAEAKPLLEQAQGIHSADGDKYGLATGLDLLGQARYRVNERAGAGQAWKEALALFQSLREDRRVEQVLDRLAELESPGACS